MEDEEHLGGIAFLMPLLKCPVLVFLFGQLVMNVQERVKNNSQGKQSDHDEDTSMIPPLVLALHFLLHPWKSSRPRPILDIAIHLPYNPSAPSLPLPRYSNANREKSNQARNRDNPQRVHVIKQETLALPRHRQQGKKSFHRPSLNHASRTNMTQSARFKEKHNQRRIVHCSRSSQQLEGHERTTDSPPTGKTQNSCSEFF